MEVESAGKSIGPDIGEYLTKKYKYKMIHHISENTYMHICTHMCIHTNAHTHMHTYAHTYVLTHMEMTLI